MFISIGAVCLYSIFTLHLVIWLIHYCTGGSPAPSAPPREAIALLPYPGRGGYGGVVSEQPFAPPSYNIASHANHVGVKPHNYMALNAFIALCCCLLCGLMGLYMGLQVRAV